MTLWPPRISLFVRGEYFELSQPDNKDKCMTPSMSHLVTISEYETSRNFILSLQICVLDIMRGSFIQIPKFIRNSRVGISVFHVVSLSTKGDREPGRARPWDIRQCRRACCGFIIPPPFSLSAPPRFSPNVMLNTLFFISQGESRRFCLGEGL